MPLWPQLGQILAGYIHSLDLTEGLLFPGKRGGMLGELRASLIVAVEAVDIEKRVTFNTLRHDGHQNPRSRRVGIPTKLLVLKNGRGGEIGKHRGLKI
ncbi:MAG: hypothetical protein ACKVIN_04410, partial [Longimicrobiales bacterium]